jgi:leader peptidase (prepilin peptidase) / N-methyltransferase
LVFWGATAILSAVLLAIAIIDLRSFRIPDTLSLPLIALGLIGAVAFVPATVHNHFIGAALGFGTLAAIGSFYFRKYGVDGLGLGDAKLFSAAGAWLGWQALPIVLLIAALTGIAFVLLRGKLHRSEALAFGPWLALGFWFVWVAPALFPAIPEFFLPHPISLKLP